MGRFFDALQRSQAERTGVDVSALPGATEPSENAELDAALQWEVALKGHGRNIAQVYLEHTEHSGTTELTESVEPEAALEWETPLKGLSKNIAQADFENQAPSGATELMESVAQEAVLERGTALRGRGKNIALVDAGNQEPPSSTASAPSAPADARTTPAITWPAPDPIPYGNQLTFAQLNATASVEGTFVYMPDPGYVLPVGTHTLWVKFTPADSGRYTPRQIAVSIVVTKATPDLSWAKPAAINYGAALSDVQLNASSPVPGRFDYSPAPGEVLAPGKHTLSATFTPDDGDNYNEAQASVSLTVARATSVIAWPTPHPITYGTQLGPAQLCAAASVPGAFEYNPGLGAVLAAGEHELSAVFIPADTVGYSTKHTSASLIVAKATPALTWPTPDPITCGAAISVTQLNATATMLGSFTYTPAAGEVLEPGVHELSVTFTPIDILNYATARAVVPITVTEKLPTQITWPVPSAISYGTALSAAQLNATASVPGTFVYTPSEGHVLARGKYILTATFTPSETDKYARTQAAVLLQVEGSPEVASPPAAATETPAALSAIDLAPEAFSQWNDEASPTSKPVSSREEWDARQGAHSFIETPKPNGQSADRGATPAHLADKPRASDSASPVPLPAPFIVKQPESTNESVDGSPNRASQKPKARRTKPEAPAAPVLPNAAAIHEIRKAREADIRKSPEPAATTKPKADEAVFQLFSSYKTKVKVERKSGKKKWIALAAVSAACLILLLLFLFIPRFYPGMNFWAKPSVPPPPSTADTKPGTDAPPPPASEPSTQETPAATTEKPKATDNRPASEPSTRETPTATDNRPASEEGGANPAPAQTTAMNNQLTAPTRIPKQQAEDAPPPAGSDTAGADGLGGNANPGMFNEHAQPTVRVAPSKPIAISSGVATGMLINSTPPVYPALARTAHVAGTVELHATISTNGRIKDLQAVSGPVMLRQAALDAVRNWRYKPFRLNNQPVEVETTINVVFTLGG